MITAVVSNGDLLLELEDGSIVNAGRVVGPAGRDGGRGLSGFPGQEGRPGRDGKDGASIRTGLGIPETSDYNEGDIYIDVQTVDLNLYQKIGGQWARLGSLKGQPGAPGAAGANGAAGGGGSTIIDPGTNTNGQGPTVDNGGDPVNEGDMWFDPETGYLYVRINNEWIAVADRPPVIISDTPPDRNNASNEDPTKLPAYPVVPGDLWFDSDQLATYVAALNSSDELVWVIATPHNRTGIASEVTRDVSNFPIQAFPRAVDKQIEINTLTDTEYIYNAPKNQWIDLSQMVHYGDAPPCHAPTGAVFTDEETLKQFIHQGDCVWVEQTSCGAGPGSGSLPGGLTDVIFTHYRSRSYQGTPFSARTILHEVYYDTQQGIHFEDEFSIQVDMQNDGSWEEVNDMDQATLDLYEIAIQFNPAATCIAFNHDYKGTFDGPWDVHPTYPCAKVRFTIKNKNLENADDFTLKSSEPMFVFPEYKQDPGISTPTPAHPGAGC